MSYKDFEQEIIRAYRVLKRELGSLQNYRDIEQWFKAGLINEHEKECLHNFSNAIYKELQEV